MAPASVTLTFSAPLLTLGYEIRVVDASSKNWVQGDLRLDRGTLTQPLASDLPGGEYQVRWRVVSSDGHPINGSYSFLVGSDAQSGAIPAPGAGTGSTIGAASDPAVVPVQSAGATSPEATPSAGFPGWLSAAGIGAAAGLGLYLAWGAFQRRRRATSDGNSSGN